jgi:hypothetical protein
VLNPLSTDSTPVTLKDIFLDSIAVGTDVLWQNAFLDTRWRFLVFCSR